MAAAWDFQAAGSSQRVADLRGKEREEGEATKDGQRGGRGIQDAPLRSRL